MVLILKVISFNVSSLFKRTTSCCFFANNSIFILRIQDHLKQAVLSHYTAEKNATLSHSELGFFLIGLLRLLMQSSNRNMHLISFTTSLKQNASYKIFIVYNAVIENCCGLRINVFWKFLFESIVSNCS